MLMYYKSKAQTLTGNPTGNYRCKLFASRALNMSCYCSQSARSIESRCVVKTVAYRLFCTNPLSDLMMVNHQSDTLGLSSVKFYSEFENFRSRKWFQQSCFHNGGNFYQTRYVHLKTTHLSEQKSPGRQPEHTGESHNLVRLDSHKMQTFSPPVQSTKPLINNVKRKTWNITMKSQWAPLCIKSLASRLFPQALVQAQINENTKTPRHWPLWGVTSGLYHEGTVTWNLSPCNDIIKPWGEGQCIIGVSNHRHLDCSSICSSTHHRKHQSSVSLAFVRGIHQWPVDSHYKGPVTRKMFPFDDAIITWREGHGFIGCHYMMLTGCLPYKDDTRVCVWSSHIKAQK